MWLDQKQSKKNQQQQQGYCICLWKFWVWSLFCLFCLWAIERRQHAVYFILSVLFVSRQKKVEYSILCSVLFVNHQEKAECCVLCPVCFVCEPSKEGRIQCTFLGLFCLWAIKRRQNIVDTHTCTATTLASHRSWICLYFQDLNYTTGSQGWMRVCLFVNTQKIATVKRTCVETGRRR